MRDDGLAVAELEVEEAPRPVLELEGVHAGDELDDAEGLGGRVAVHLGQELEPAERRAEPRRRLPRILPYGREGQPSRVIGRPGGPVHGPHEGPTGRLLHEAHAHVRRLGDVQLDRRGVRRADLERLVVAEGLDAREVGPR